MASRAGRGQGCDTGEQQPQVHRAQPSENGEPLQFGFIRGTSARFPITVVHGVDNWKLTIHR